MTRALTLAVQGIGRWAEFSPDRRFRYLLGREWDASKPRACWIGHNPSYADEHRDDMTATKYIEFSRRNDFGSYVAVNRIPLVATNPDDLPSDPPALWLPPLAQDASARYWNGAIRDSTAIILAWGNIGWPDEAIRRDRIIETLLTHGKPVLCLGKTKFGNPRHASRLAYTTPLVLFEVQS